jgi:hypothetical protein
MKLSRLLLLFTLLLPALVLAWNQAANFTGVYRGSSEGEQYELNLQQTGSTLSGTAKALGQNIPINGTVSGSTASGTLSGSQFKLYFRAELNGDQLKFRISESESMVESDEIVFTRVSGGAPAKEAESQEPAKFSKEPTGILKSGKEYTHASGGKFRYPASWQLRELDEALQLIPPDAGQDEIYAVVAESAEGAKDPASREVLAYLDAAVAELFPFARRVGQPEVVSAGAGKGIVITYEGQHQGQPFRVRGFVTIIKNYGVALVAAGPKAKIEQRDPALREIFHSFGWGQATLDKNLIGTWNHWSYTGTGNYGRETRANIIMRPDGTFVYESDSETSMSAEGRNSLGNVEWTGGMASRRGSGWKGMWAADGTNLILTFEDGTSETFSYRFKQESSGNVFLVVTEAGGKKSTEWARGN